MHLDALKKANNKVRCIYVCKKCGFSTTYNSNFNKHLTRTEKIEENDRKMYTVRID